MLVRCGRASQGLRQTTIPGFAAAGGFANSARLPRFRRPLLSPGGVAARFKAPVLKTGMGGSPSWVRIPPPPPLSRVSAPETWVTDCTYDIGYTLHQNGLSYVCKGFS